MMILAIDPGKDKIGMALYDEGAAAVIYHGIAQRDELQEQLRHLAADYGLDRCVLGNGTHSVAVQAQVRQAVPGCPVVLIDEAYSTLEARQLYFRLYPPRGLRRLIPRSMQTPAGPVDDLVAVILLKRHLGDMPPIGK